MSIRLIRYLQNQYDEQFIDAGEIAEIPFDRNMVNWLDVEMLDSDVVLQVSQRLDIHPLIVEDILNVSHLPKIELFEDYFFVTLKMLRLTEEEGSVAVDQEHVSLMVGAYFVVSFQEGREGDVFDSVRKLIANEVSQLRRLSPDFLFYHILDAVVDHYLEIMEAVREEIESLEDMAAEGKRFNLNDDVLRLKKEVSRIRKYALPLLNVVRRLKSDASGFVGATSGTYFNDIQDHILFVLSSSEQFHEVFKDLVELHQSNLNNETNRVMKTLTVVASIFIPLTFVAGLYGMNFKYMPELEYTWAYPAVLIVMLLTAVGMVVYMRYKRWI